MGEITLEINQGKSHPIRVAHTSDWHLGKKLYGHRRLEEQKQFLVWLANQLHEKDIDVLLIAGDIFDTPYPPYEALETYYNFLESVKQTHIVLISGNHDSRSLIKGPQKILQQVNVHCIVDLPDFESDNSLCFKKADHRLEIKALPFFRSFEVNESIEQDIESWSQSWAYKNSYKLIMCHHAIGNFTSSPSEHLVSFLGDSGIPPQLFKGADYLALGHIHRPQRVSENAYYSGSPIAMRFSETHQKQINLITIGKETTIDFLPIPEFQRLFRLEGDYLSVQKLVQQIGPTTGIAEINIKDKRPDPQVNFEIEQQLKAKGIKLLSLQMSLESSPEQRADVDFLTKSVESMFEDFYQEHYGEKINQQVREVFTELYQQ